MTKQSIKERYLSLYYALEAEIINSVIRNDDAHYISRLTEACDEYWDLYESAGELA